MSRSRSSGSGCGAFIAGLVALGILLWLVSAVGHVLGLTPTASELDTSAEKNYENVGLGYVLTILVIVAPFALYFLGRWYARTHPGDQRGLIAIVAGPALALLLAVIFLPAGRRSESSSQPVRASNLAPPSPPVSFPRPKRHHHHRRPPPPPVQHHRAKPPPAPAPQPAECPPRSKVLQGVYHPDRLLVRDPCRKVTGVVEDVRDEEDGDIHVLVRLDHQYDDMLIANNHSEQNGDLVVEFMPRDYGHLPRPGIGDRLMLVGAYVDDTEHAWAEIHPVWAVSINGGPINRSGSQFGGSPAYALSSNALATCHTNTGARCHGYNGEVAPPSDDESSKPSGGDGSSNGSGGACTPGYSPCLPPASDYDCEGGSGDGPKFTGQVQVTGSDPYGLDTDGDGVGCE